MTQNKGLGRGLDSFGGKGLEAFFAEKPAAPSGIKTVPLDSIFPNRSQPRDIFSEEQLKDLSVSISKDGILQPLIVAPATEGRHELIAGERRWRAARMAGLKEVPVVIRGATEEQRLEWALIENIQRENLNRMEEAKAYQQLVEQFQWAAADVAERVGKSREHVANMVRLLKLPKLVQEDVSNGKMTMGHARALLALDRLEEQLHLREKILENSLSVRDIERMIQERGGVRRKRVVRSKKNLPVQIKLVLDEIQQALGTKVRIQGSSGQEGRGQLVVEFFSYQDLDRLYRKIVQK